MIKFTIVGRKKPEITQERYFYEWGIIHVALMISTPAVMKIFKRYVQHYALLDIKSENLIHPLSGMSWGNMANHWVETDEDLVEAVHASDYIIRMQPHSFGDKEFVLQVVVEKMKYESDDFKSGGVKLMQFINPASGVAEIDFLDHWENNYANALIEVAGNSGPLRKYVQNTRRHLNPEFFTGSLFQRGGVNHYLGFEEFWFDTTADMLEFCRDRTIVDIVSTNSCSLIDPNDCFSLATTERVLYDYTKGEDSSPLAAVLQSGTLEREIYEQGLSDWHIPANSD